MLMLWIWVVSLLVSIYLADQKKRSVGGFFLLALLTGPLTVILLVLLPSKSRTVSAPDQGIFSLEEARHQLEDVRASLLLLEEKTRKLEEFIAGRSPVQLPPVNVDEPLQFRPDLKPELDPGLQPETAALARPQADLELDFARNWLNKIGIAALVLGVAFLITYSFAYVGPVLKILSGYVIAGVLFFTGFRLEQKDQFRNYGRVLLGGAWGLVYFTTYAMYHFETSRIIASQGIDLFLLALVVCGMMVHALRHKSQALVSVVLCVAYLTLGIGEVTGFTLVSLLFLAILSLYFVYRFQWVGILSLGIGLTYITHYLWLMPALDPSFAGSLFRTMPSTDYYDWASLVLLSCYWIIFLVGTHLVRAAVDPLQARTLAASNFWNVAMYGLLSFPLVTRQFFYQHYILVAAVGLVYLGCALLMKRLGREKLCRSDIVCAVFALTFSVALKFLPATALLVWMIEVPFLLFIGMSFGQRLYRVMAYILAGLVAWRVFFLGMSFMPETSFLGILWPWYGFMSFWAGLSAAVCFCLTQKIIKIAGADESDRFFDHAFSFAAFMYFMVALWSVVRQPWISLFLSLGVMALLALSQVLGLRRFRAYAAVLASVVAVVFILEPVRAVNPFLRWFIAAVDVLPFFVLYEMVQRIARRRPGDLFFPYEPVLALVLGLMVLVTAMHQYCPQQWVSLGLGLSSVVLLLLGLFSGSKNSRMGGMLLLALTLGRVVFVDLSGLELVFKIITLMVLGVLFLGVSYVYTRFGCDFDKPLL